ncbi:MAG: hypothetical protein FJX64_06335 [Alphaproteobacteria bacterium]|nr:hypothetical protein [Alphaproteobacteria bacterium]
MKRARTFLVRLLAALTAGFIVVPAGAMWLVSTGPVSLGFLTPYFAEALNRSAAGYQVVFADTVLAWGGWHRTLDLRVVDVRVLDPTDVVIAQAPEISITLSARALLQGIVAPTRVDLIQPSLRLVRNEDGRLAIGDAFGDARRAGGMLEFLLGALSQPPPPGTPISYLSRIGIAGARVWIEDRAAAAEWFAPQLDAILTRKTAGVSAELDLILALESGAVNFTATADYADIPGVLTVAAAFTDVNPMALTKSAPRLAELGSVDALVSGNVAALVTRDGTISRIEFDLASGPGIVTAGSIWEQPLWFDSATVRGTVLDSLRTVRIDDLFVAQSGATGEASGLFTFDPVGLGFVVDASFSNLPADRFDAMWPKTLAPLTRAWVTENVHAGLVQQGTLHLRAAPGEVPLMPAKGDVDLRFTYTGGVLTYLKGQPDLRDARGAGRLTARDFEITVESGRVGALAVAEGAVHIDSFLTVPSMVVELVASGPTAEAMRILSLAPLSLGLPAGYGGDTAARAQLALPVMAALTAQQVKYAAAANLRDLSIPTGSARLTLNGGTISLRADAGGLEAQGTIAANGTPLRVDASIPVRAGQAIQVTASGTLSDEARRRLGLDLGALVQGPVGAIARLELQPGAFNAFGLRRGSFVLDLTTARIDLPGEGWDKAIAQPATANLLLEPAADGMLRFPGVMLHSPQIEANGQFAVDPRTATVEGTAELNGYAMTFAWKPGDAPGAGHFSATAKGDEKLLAAFGYDLSQWLTGPLQATAVADTAGTEPGTLRIGLDLREATVATPMYSKPPGQDGFAEVTFVPDATRSYRLRSFAGTSVGLAVSGAIEAAAAPQPGWRRIQIARLILGEGSLNATIDRQDNGTLAVTAQGQKLDIRPLLGGATADRQGASTLQLPPLQLSGRFDSLVLGPDRTLTDASGTAVYQGGAWRSLGATAKMPGGASVAIALADAEDGQDISISATDAGAFLASFGLFQGAVGGSLEMNGKVKQTGGTSLEGTLVAKNFRVVRAPALLQLLQVASPFGIVESLQGPGIPFVDFTSPFRISANRVVLAESRARGASLGVTVEGTLDRNTGAMNFSGTIVPFYAINALLRDIPVLGDILFGEGVFATNYRVSGTTASPVITVNPLSTLAPGILRELMP